MAKHNVGDLLMQKCGILGTIRWAEPYKLDNVYKIEWLTESFIKSDYLYTPREISRYKKILEEYRRKNA